MKYLIRFATVCQALFVVMMTVFWIRFAYLGVLLTHVVRVEQAATLFATQNLFVVNAVRIAVSWQGSIVNLVVTLIVSIPVGFVLFAFVAMMNPNPRWKNMNRIHVLMAVLVQGLFLGSLGVMMNTFTTLGNAIAQVHLIGWVSSCIGLVFTAGCVYTLVRLVVTYYSSVSEVQTYD